MSGYLLNTKANTLMSSFLLLFSLIFTASNAEVARSNRAGQANLAETMELPWSIVIY